MNRKAKGSDQEKKPNKFSTQILDALIKFEMCDSVLRPATP
jgi:hypothetical protein